MAAFVTKGTAFRNSKTHQFIFVNGRPVKDQTLSHAVYDAFEGILPHEKHPVFFLYIDFDPRRVDFNVHPAKREVRFENRQEIHRFVRNALREAVRRERADYVTAFSEAPAISVSEGFAPFDGRDASALPRSADEGPSSGVPQSLESPGLFLRPAQPFIYLGDTFIAVAGTGGLTLIDHHAAHERVLYESFLKGTNLDSHRLLFPKQIRLSRKEYAVIIENKEMLSEMGLEIDDFGHDTLIVRSLPAALKEADLRGILADVAGALLEGVKPFQSLREVLAARIACHSSVRGSDILHQEELRKLLDGLEAAENPDQCPHGRPTRIFLSLDDLKKMFKRK